MKKKKEERRKIIIVEIYPEANVEYDGFLKEFTDLLLNYKNLAWEFKVVVRKEK